MGKSLSLVLSAALSLWTMMPASALHPAKMTDSWRAGVSQIIKTKAGQRHQVKFDLKKARPLASGAVANKRGFATVATDLRVRNHKAVRSATAARRTEADRAVARTVNLQGLVVYSDTWSDDYHPYGIYMLPKTSGGSFDLLAPTENPYIYGAIDDGRGNFYGTMLVENVFQYVAIDVYETNPW